MGSGGSRSGAGRPAYNAKAGDLISIDVRDFAKRGYLDRNVSFTWHWSRGEEPAGSISIYVVARSFITLRYTQTIKGEARDYANQVDLTYTPCHFGKSRPWLFCPFCNRRLAKLYLRAGRFACRHCQNVAFNSQSESVAGRSWRTQRKIEAKIGQDWQRPKGMRLATFQRLQLKLYANMNSRYAALEVSTARLIGSMERMTAKIGARKT